MGRHGNREDKGQFLDNKIFETNLTEEESINTHRPVMRLLLCYYNYTNITYTYLISYSE